MKKILEKAYIQWRYVNTKENPADLGSRGGKVDESTQLWLKGPEWLCKQDVWPDGITTVSTVESRAELKPVKEILAIAVEEKNLFDDLLEKYELWKTIRIMAWIKRFSFNAKQRNREDIRSNYYSGNRSSIEFLDKENSGSRTKQSKIQRRPCET